MWRQFNFPRKWRSTLGQVWGLVGGRLSFFLLIWSIKGEGSGIWKDLGLWGVDSVLISRSGLGVMQCLIDKKHVSAHFFLLDSAGLSRTSPLYSGRDSRIVGQSLGKTSWVSRSSDSCSRKRCADISMSIWSKVAWTAGALAELYPQSANFSQAWW